MTHTHQTQPTSMHARALPHSLRSLRRLNIGLTVVALMLLGYYVTQVTMMASQTWNMRDAHVQLSMLTDERNALIAQEASLEDRVALTDLAQRQGLVPASTVVYLVQGNAVAAR